MRDGILNINKPPGWTSHDVVARVRSMLNIKKVGHAGTLDPDATGVLPVCFGKGTKIVEYLIGADKEYRAVMRLGMETDTEDIGGAVLKRTDATRVSEPAVREAMEAFVGPYDQIPPAYSAIKVNGRPLYKEARAGRTVVRTARRVQIHRLHFERMTDGDVWFSVHCSKGTYVRTLCADIGQRLSVGACLLRLSRTRSGMFRLEDAVELDTLERAIREGEWEKWACRLGEVLADLPAFVVDPTWADRVRHGIAPALSAFSDRDRDRLCGVQGLVRIEDRQGELLALARVQDRKRGSHPDLRIEKVLASHGEDDTQRKVGIGSIRSASPCVPPTREAINRRKSKLN